MQREKKKETNCFAEFLVGVGMMIAGVVILLMNIHVSSFGFLRFGRISSAPILVIVFLFLMVWAVIRGKTFQWILVGADILCIIISVLLGTEFYFARMTVFTLLLMLALLAVGLGLMIRNLACLKNR